MYACVSDCIYLFHYLKCSISKPFVLQNEKPIEAANAFLLPLEQFRPNCFETHHFAFMVAERRGKLLQMLRALLRCRKYLTSDNTTTNTANVAAAAVDQANMAEYHLCKVRFVHKG